jgi:predicted XRE-type DNA-binding protein
MTRRRATKPTDEIAVTRGSGNVFADIGLPNAEEHLAKAQLVSLIDDALRARRLTQQKAAAVLGIDQPTVSRMLRGHFDGISTQRLIDFLTALGRDVDIVVRTAPRSRKRGRLHVDAA